MWDAIYDCLFFCINQDIYDSLTPEQQQVVGVVCARGALGLVEAVVLQVGGEVLFDAPCDIGGFQSPPTVIRSLVLQMLLVHLTLNVLPVSADFSRHADGDFIRIQKGGDFDILLSHGLFQERFSALLTDAIRAAVLEDEGYDVDVIEFIDFAHSPKNLMLRCHRTGHRGTKKLTETRRLRDQYGFEQTLLSLVENGRK